MTYAEKYRKRVRWAADRVSAADLDPDLDSDEITAICESHFVDKKDVLAELEKRKAH